MLWNLVDKSKLIDSYGLKHLALVILLVAFSLLGGFIFCALEAPNELHKRDAMRQRYELIGGWARGNLSTRLLVLLADDTMSDIYRQKLIEYAIRDYDRSMGVDAAGSGVPKKWTIWGGLYYSFTLYTTIGYGDIAPETTSGRMATVIYAIFGVPLVITVLNDWGTLLFTVIRNLWRVKLRKSISFLLASATVLCKQTRESITTDQVNSDEFDDEQQSIPLKLAIFLLLFWILVCASIFCLFEHWTMFDSIYFFFISLTTIGLGDITPSHKVAVMNALLILIGLSVVSMSIHVIQMKLEHIFNRIVMSIDSDFKKSLENGTYFTIDHNFLDLESFLFLPCLKARSHDAQTMREFFEIGASDWLISYSTNQKRRFRKIYASFAHHVNEPLHWLWSFSIEEKRRIVMRMGDGVERRPSRGGTTATGSVDRYAAKMNGTDRLLLKLMSAHQRHLLDQRYDERSNMRNRATQTGWQSTHISVQTDDNVRHRMAESTTTNGDLPISRFNHKRMYIYNIDD